jgi:hypothetical protein
VKANRNNQGPVRKFILSFTLSGAIHGFPVSRLGTENSSCEIPEDVVQRKK